MSDSVMGKFRTLIEFGDDVLEDSSLYQKTVPLWISVNGLDLPNAITTIRINKEEPNHAIIITTMMLEMRNPTLCLESIDELITALQQARDVMADV